MGSSGCVSDCIWIKNKEKLCECEKENMSEAAGSEKSLVKRYIDEKTIENHRFYVETGSDAWPKAS
jgi:hypothetical protein